MTTTNKEPAESPTRRKRLDTDGTFAGLRHTIADGVPKPKNSSSPMPQRGGARLSDADVADVAAYVWAISHPDGK